MTKLTLEQELELVLYLFSCLHETTQSRRGNPELSPKDKKGMRSTRVIPRLGFLHFHGLIAHTKFHNNRSLLLHEVIESVKNKKRGYF